MAMHHGETLVAICNEKIRDDKETLVLTKRHFFFVITKRHFCADEETLVAICNEKTRNEEKTRETTCVCVCIHL